MRFPVCTGLVTLPPLAMPASESLLLARSGEADARLGLLPLGARRVAGIASVHGFRPVVSHVRAHLTHSRISSAPQQQQLSLPWALRESTGL